MAAIDFERNAVLQFVSGRGSVPDADAMLLTVHGVPIPMDVQFVTGQTNPPPSPLSYIFSIDTFGESRTVESKMGVGSTSFQSSTQRSALLLLAVEAMLVFGRHGDGLSRPDGEVLVNHLDRLWKLSDFGYADKGEIN